MAKATKKSNRASSIANAGSSRSRQKRPGNSAENSRKETKQSRAIALLRSGKGATIDSLMKATGWQQHSVRGFLAGVVRKRLKLQLASEIVGGNRVYRVSGLEAQTGSASRADQQQS